MNGEPRTPSAPMARRVLALLLSHADRVVPMELLIDELWGEQPPKTARKTVQTYVYQLRKTLCGDEPPVQGQELLETHPHGYRLPLQGCRLDVQEFQTLLREGREALAQGRAGESAVLLRRSLELWRGAPLEGVETGPLLAAQTARLERLRIQALEQRIAADLALGGDQSLLEEIRDLTHHYPLHEEFCAQLMTAARRCGQRGEALSAYARLRRAMAEQLGLEPSARLRELQNGVLTGHDEPTRAPSRAGAVSAPFQLPPAIGDFVGRRDELDRIERALRETGALPGVRIVTVTGAPGMGKTQIALQVAHRLRADFPDGQLKASLHMEDGTAQPPAETLKELLAAVGHDRLSLPGRTDDLARMFRSWAAGRRFLLLLDDAAGREEVLPLLPAGVDNAVVVTSRWRMIGLPGAVTSLEVGLMPAADGRRLLANMIGTDRTAREPDAAAAIVARCEGMPTAIRAIGSRITAWPGRSLADFAARLTDERGRLEELSGPHLDVRRYLVGAADRLPQAAREVLAEISSAGDADVTVPYLAHVLRRSVPSIEHSVELLTAFRVLTPVMRDGRHVLRVPPLMRLAFAREDHSRTGGSSAGSVMIGDHDCSYAVQICSCPLEWDSLRPENRPRRTAPA
ncbi:BTAD domain-containing putative transcriptional regulator [Streptomyces sp. NPDC007346]|uniref:AfsR/SARP family transcriptional regulator n=1 Tax=Streptomyces sp. NPDC007346 TaxID=3154682 RepID=UPI003451567E